MRSTFCRIVLVLCFVLGLVALEPSADSAEADVSSDLPVEIEGVVGRQSALIVDFCTTIFCTNASTNPPRGHEVPGGPDGNCTLQGRIEWRGTFWSGPVRKVRYDFAKTEMIERCAHNYKANAHATLIPDNIGNNAVFSVFTNACASRTIDNNDAQTCESDKFGSDKDKRWFWISGYWIDVNGDGTKDAECAGCIDLEWRHP